MGSSRLSAARRDSELGKIDEAASRTWRRIEPMAGRIGEDLKRDALAVIDSAEITSDDLYEGKADGADGSVERTGLGGSETPRAAIR